MKIVLPGGSGQVGMLLARAFAARGDEVVVLSRQPAKASWKVVAWDARNAGAWTAEIDGADVVINLAGRNVNCRYTAKNRAEILHSRVDSTHAVGASIAAARHPPRVWLQMSTATIYADRYDAANDEDTGILGGNEAGVPARWRFSIEVAKAWESAAAARETSGTRQVLMRSAVVMSPDRGGVFDVLMGLARKRLAGKNGHGRQ